MKAIILLLASMIYSANAQCGFVKCQNLGTCKPEINPANNFYCYCTPGFSGSFCTDKTTLTASAANVPVGGSVTFTCTTNIGVDTSVNSYVFSLFRQISGGTSAPDGGDAGVASTNGGPANPVTWTQTRTLNTPGTFKYLCKVKTGVTVEKSGVSNEVTVTVGSADPCAGKDCNNGRCVVKNNQGVCECDKGWWGAACTQRDICQNIKCKNGGTCTPLASSPFYRCACPRGYSGNFCQIVSVGAPCTISKQCKGTVCGSANLEGYCKVPEFTCQCQSDIRPPCKKHADCNTGCVQTGGFGLCMKDNTCECFTSLDQMLFYMTAYDYPSSPPFVAM